MTNTQAIPIFIGLCISPISLTPALEAHYKAKKGIKNNAAGQPINFLTALAVMMAMIGGEIISQHSTKMNWPMIGAGMMVLLITSLPYVVGFHYYTPVLAHKRVEKGTLAWGGNLWWALGLGLYLHYRSHSILGESAIGFTLFAGTWLHIRSFFCGKGISKQ